MEQIKMELSPRRNYVEIRATPLAPYYHDEARSEIIRLELGTSLQGGLEVRLYNSLVYDKKQDPEKGERGIDASLLIETSARKDHFDTEYDLQCLARATIRANGGIAQLSYKQIWEIVYTSRLETAVARAFKCGVENSADRVNLPIDLFPDLFCSSIDQVRTYARILGLHFSEKSAQQLLNYKMQQYYQYRYDMELESAAASVVHYKSQRVKSYLKKAAKWAKKAGIGKVNPAVLDERVKSCRERYNKAMEEIRKWMREKPLIKKAE